MARLQSHVVASSAIVTASNNRMAEQKRRLYFCPSIGCWTSFRPCWGALIGPVDQQVGFYRHPSSLRHDSIQHYPKHDLFAPISVSVTQEQFELCGGRVIREPHKGKHAGTAVLEKADSRERLWNLARVHTYASRPPLLPRFQAAVLLCTMLAGEKEQGERRGWETGIGFGIGIGIGTGISISIATCSDAALWSSCGSLTTLATELQHVDPFVLQQGSAGEDTPAAEETAGVPGEPPAAHSEPGVEEAVRV